MNEKKLQQSVSRKFINYLKNNNIDVNLKKEFLVQCRKNYWLKYVYENKKNIGDKWCDFEYLIGLQVEALSFIANNPEKINDENLKYNRNIVNIEMINNKLKQMEKLGFRKSIQKQREVMLDDLEKLTWMLEIYLERFLNDKRTPVKLFQVLPVDYILSFNYTDTYQRMYRTPREIHYIHGYANIKRNREDNNMVFGIGQDIKNSNDEDALDYVMFQKYFQRIVKKTGNSYKQWLKDDEEIQVIIYGHSLDKPDGDIIKKFVEHPKSKIFIFYFDKNALNNIVVNLIDIFDKETIVDLTSNEKITFAQCDDNISINHIIKNDPQSLMKIANNSRKRKGE